jgi:DNA-binding NtrC family response regulator
LHPSILVIEDEDVVRSALARRLEQQGYAVGVSASATEGFRQLEEGTTDLVLLDYRLPDAEGLEALEKIRKGWPDIPVIMMTAFTNVETAIQAMRLGAHNYVSKPFTLDEMMVVVDKALETRLLRSEIDRIRSTQLNEFGFDRLLARSPSMVEIIQLLRHLVESEARTILLQGESGTGKDLAAKVIHYNGARAEHPFMNITCTALPESLLESELFGHERGAFTDAHQQKQGLFELADGGTIFLDEIGDMPVPLQSKLLRFLEEKMFRRVGGTKDLRVDVCIIAATNRDIRALVDQDKFREDLFYRLNIFPVTLPPLRQRPEDVELLANHFIRTFNREFRKDIKGIEPAALAVMQAHRWPGNIRELRNMIERAVLLARAGQLTMADLPVEIRQPADDDAARPPAHPTIQLGPDGVDIREVERLLVKQALERTNGNQSRAAAMLRMSRDQFRYRLHKYGIRIREEKPVGEARPT